ncbi:hypothetical protein AQUCO_02800150v1 [Aquilegia coerulea]|uniref:Cytochrome P450 n=1 Tax=Aquilegia coerulea TaxID=218851 RepID=A0A2G5D430_AQUCA|nr:hypothetical protein AQUCO_02800150v1 [Aquilegia coerulea]
MEWTLTYTIWSCIWLGVAILFMKEKFLVSDKKLLPPGPPGWPIIGNLLDLGGAPHHSLMSLSKKYGPVIWLRFGAVNTMVVSSADAAMELFKNHDLTFADRKTNEAMKVGGADQGSISLCEYGPYWRMLRRICATELFSGKRIKDTETLRANCTDKLKKWICEEGQKKGSIEIARIVALGSFNVIINATLSKDNIIDPQSKEGTEFVSSINRVTEFFGKPNVADFFPFLRWLDPQGVKKNIERAIVHPLNFATGFVKERILQRQSGHITSRKDFLDVMLEFQGNEKDGEPTKISEENINLLIMELFISSTDSTSNTIEWAMSELLRNPNIMRNVQEELDQVVGQNRKVEESDIGKLHYLQAVVKETLRLHPPGPLLVPRRARKNTVFMGYSIPKETQVLVNVWAIGRDPVSWDDPLSFKPERFLNSSVDFKGQHFQFLPFGGGRRICAGILLAERILHLVLGSLIHSFEWSLEDGITPETMDMMESLGIVLRKADPLRVKVKERMVLMNSVKEI